MRENIDFDYEILQLGVHKELNGLKNVVYEIRGILIGTSKILEDGETQPKVEKQLFVVAVPTDNLENFIEYENVTKDVVIDWILKISNHNLIEPLKEKITKEIFNDKEYLKPNF